MADDDNKPTGKVIRFPMIERIEAMLPDAPNPDPFDEWMPVYKLVNRIPVRVRSEGKLDALTRGIMERSLTIKETDIDPWRVANTDIGPINISTVFLGLDHNFSRRFGGKGEPLLFETMIFGGEFDENQWRCSTWEQAEAQHAEAVDMVKRLRAVK